ncbi:MAG: bifunctional glutamate N-acetyltransferase/amino-acid acetyltransferase ArgJ [candidate division Zixibacteria bacterium]|nr:bifunctional glutamate N-acetyltransferase/amino-acid acetyltransferase ArgJ [candidate division Zixibacteria bacterium]
MLKNITNVRGIKCWGAHTGVKSMRRDLAIIYSEKPASAAAMFTQNKVVAEPIKISKRHIADGKVQAIVINAGNANACTGQQGLKGAEAMALTTAEELGIDKELVIVASTGMIGEPFPTEDIVKGIQENIKKLSDRSNAGSFVANAILTTDTFPKEGFEEFDLDGYEVNIGGIAKGSGMIHPNMATMLAFIITDAAIEPKLLKKTVKEAVDKSFNMITVDGVTSTNDMVVVMANGLANNDTLKSKKDAGYAAFKENLENMMIHLAKLIVSDGEGSSKFIQYVVTNAPNEVTAKKLVREISGSILVKTAIFGRDPNWGRIICAAGNAGVAFDYRKADLYMGDEKKLVKVLEKGKPQDYNRNFMKTLLRESHVHIKLDLHNGKASATGWGADLTTDYVLFNSVYST